MTTQENTSASLNRKNHPFRERLRDFIKGYNLDIVAISLAVIGCVWLIASTTSRINTQLENIQEDITKMEKDVKQIQNDVTSIRMGRSSLDSICQNRNASITNRISRIEGKLSIWHE